MVFNSETLAPHAEAEHKEAEPYGEALHAEAEHNKEAKPKFFFV